MKWYGETISPSHDVLDMFAHFILICWNPYMTLHIKEYPVFKPNEYFWQNHWQNTTEPKEKW